VINELGGTEKIDIIQWNDTSDMFIRAALSPAKDIEVIINEKSKTASAFVPDDQLSLAIGKDGQNVRLAAKLTGWKIDIKSKSEKTKSNKLEVSGKKLTDKKTTTKEKKESGTQKKKSTDAGKKNDKKKALVIT